jgi:protein-S-isoprenylcysteine O-methyltransferase Ste14
MNTSLKSDNPGVIALPPVLYGIAFAIVLLLRWLWPLPVRAYPAPFWAGISVIVLGGALALWGQRTMKAAGTNVNPSQPTTAIVTSGPFRYSRNPLYLALTLLFMGLSLAVNTWWGLIVAAPLLIVMHYGVILREERYLAHKFGASYETYTNSVRRYL